jgi:hypothetical protein
MTRSNSTKLATLRNIRIPSTDLFGSGITIDLIGAKGFGHGFLDRSAMQVLGE